MLSDSEVYRQYRPSLTGNTRNVSRETIKLNSLEVMKVITLITIHLFQVTQ